MEHGIVISDLHLFSNRSDGASLFEGIGAPLDQADVLVLNGDIFDFRWSHLPSEEATIVAALNWVERLIRQNRWKRIHYIFGNHDCLTDFKTPLEALAEDQPELVCHDYQLRLGRNLFLHGDCANRKMDEAALRRYRMGWSQDRPRGAMHKVIYDGADAIGLSGLFHDWYFPTQRSTARVAHHLDHVMPEWRDQLDHCYFGHTHRPFTNHAHEGVHFHNTGSGIRGMGFQPLTFHPQPEQG